MEKRDCALVERWVVNVEKIAEKGSDDEGLNF